MLRQTVERSTLLLLTFNSNIISVLYIHAIYFSHSTIILQYRLQYFYMLFTSTFSYYYCYVCVLIF